MKKQFSRFYDQKNQKIKHWTGLIDVAPMIIGAAGLNIPKEMQGSAILDENRRPVFAEEDHEGNVLYSVRFDPRLL